MYTIVTLIVNYMCITPIPQSSDNALVQSAGVDCLTSLCQLLGKMILRGRIEQHNPTWVWHCVNVYSFCLNLCGHYQTHFAELLCVTSSLVYNMIIIVNDSIIGNSCYTVGLRSRVWITHHMHVYALRQVLLWSGSFATTSLAHELQL